MATPTNPLNAFNQSQPQPPITPRQPEAIGDSTIERHVRWGTIKSPLNATVRVQRRHGHSGCAWLLKRAAETTCEELKVRKVGITIVIDVAKWATRRIDRQTRRRVVAHIIDVDNTVTIRIRSAAYLS